MRRIYLDIYVGVVGTALVVTLVLAAFGHWYFEGRLDAERARLEATGNAILEALPLEAPPDVVQFALFEQARRAGVSAILLDAQGQVRASAGPAAHRRRPGEEATRDRPDDPRPHRRRRHVVWATVDARDGGALELARAHPPGPPHMGPWVFVVLFFGVVALGAYPVARRIARGLEQLREGVQGLGEGDLSTRVAIEGRNEVADVARAFNVAAEKIQRGVEAQRRMLASASHELRSPLGRLRAAVELLAAGQRDRLPEAERNIAELDGLIDDLLLAARLEVAPPAPRHDPVDLLAIVREEADRVGADLAGQAPPIRGDGRLLRRLVRNLLENASQHGAPPIAVRVEANERENRVRLEVSDAGPGVPVDERDRIFEAFYRPPGHAEWRDGGVGLGLALVADIAAHHGGTARCVARGEHGSAFRVDLPLGPEDADAPLSDAGQG